MASRSGLFDDFETEADSGKAVGRSRSGLFDDFDEPQEKQTRAPIVDAAYQGVRGFNRGLDDFLKFPARLTAAAYDNTIGALTGTRYPDVDAPNPVSDFLLQGGAPETTAGRIAYQAGQAVGGSVVPSAGFVAQAPKIAQFAQRAAAATAPGAVNNAAAGALREGAEYAAANPTAAFGLDVASAAGAGAGGQVAREAELGPVGEFAGTMVGAMAPGVAMSYRNPSTGRIGTETGETIAARRAAEAQADLDAFERLGVRPLGPTFHQGPMGSIAKQLSETPFVGAPLRDAASETYEDLAHVGRTLTGSLADDTSAATVGDVLQRGLNRWSNDTLADLPPRTVAGITAPAPGGNPGQLPVPAGINPMAPPAPLPMSHGARTLANNMAPVRAAEGLPAQQMTRSRRTGAGDLSNPQLDAIIANPSANTSFATKAEALYERSWRALPLRFRRNDARNPDLVNAAATRQALVGIDGQIANQIAGQGTIGGQLAERIRNPRSNFTLQDLRAIRTEVGRAIGNTNPLQATLNRRQLRDLYWAISNDIQVGLDTVANRALQDYQNGVQGIRRQDVVAAAGAAREFRRADRFYRAGMERVESFARILGADSPEKAISILDRAIQDGGKGNVNLMRRAMQALQPAEREIIAARLIESWGQPKSSGTGLPAEMGFSPGAFMRRYSDTNPEALDLIFPPAHRQAIEDLYRAAQRVASYEELVNSSRTGTNTLNVTGTVGAVASALAGNFQLPLLIGGSGWGLSILMSRPEYARWMIRYMRLRARVRAGTDKMIAPLIRHVGNLEVQARANPALLPVLAMVKSDAEEAMGAQE